MACTNLLIEHKRLSRTYSRERDVKWTTKAELLALIGLLYLTGVKRANHTNLLELWTDDGTGLEICRSTMSYRQAMRETEYKNPLCVVSSVIAKEK